VREQHGCRCHRHPCADFFSLSACLSSSPACWLGCLLAGLSGRERALFKRQVAAGQGKGRKGGENERTNEGTNEGKEEEGGEEARKTMVVPEKERKGAKERGVRRRSLTAHVPRACALALALCL